MASACGQLSSSMYRRTDSVYDFPCTACVESGMNSEAEVFCRDCCKQFCTICEPRHKVMYQKHGVMEKSKQSRWPKPKITFALEMCGVHGNEKLTDRCMDHDQLCCLRCKDEDHSACANFVPIETLAKGISDKPEYQSMFSDDGAIATRQAELSTLGNLLEAKKDDIDNSATQYLADIQALQDVINQRLNKLKADTIEQIRTGKDRVKKGVDEDIQEISGTKDCLSQLVADVQTKSAIRESLSYIGYEKCKDTLSSSDKTMADISQREYTLEFKPNTSLESHMELLNSMGVIKVSPSTTQDSHQQVSGGRMRPADSLAVHSRHTYNIRIPEDTHGVCQIAGMCQLNTGELIVIDRANGKIKVLDEGYTVVNHADLPDIPQDACRVKDNRVAVAINDARKQKHQIWFIDFIYGHLTRTGKLHLNHDCYFIDHHEGLLYAGDRSDVYLYTATGAPIYRPLSTSGIRHMAVGDDGQVIYVANHTINVISGSKPGRQVRHLEAHADEPNSAYVCFSDRGHVFLALGDGNGVYQMGAIGGREPALLINRSLIKSAIALCFNRNTQQLIVGQDLSDEIVVFGLKNA